jgi:outer membrane protein TolC
VLAQETDQQQHAVAAAQEFLELATNRYKGGVDTYLQVLTAQTIALANERNAIDIQRRRLDASVLLIKAIGGGWHVADLPSLAQARRAPDS